MDPWTYTLDQSRRAATSFSATFLRFFSLLHCGKRTDETCAYDSAISKFAIAGHGGVDDLYPQAG